MQIKPQNNDKHLPFCGKQVWSVHRNLPASDRNDAYLDINYKLSIL